MYKPEKYDQNDVVLSVGSFAFDTLEQWQLHCRCLVVDYEATPEVYEVKRKLEAFNGQRYGRLECHPEAITDTSGEKILYRYRGGARGDTILTQWQDHVRPEEYFVGQVKIKTVSMSQVLQRFEKIKEAHLNCEGSEIPILMNTPLELLGRCQWIGCEFHRFSSFLKITDGDVRQCVARLTSLFDSVCVEDYHPYYEFTRKA